MSYYQKKTFWEFCNDFTFGNLQRKQSSAPFSFEGEWEVGETGRRGKWSDVFFKNQGGV